jgi:hypothetical protein
MADPISLGVMAAVGIGSSAVGGVVSGLGAQQSGQAQAQAYQYKAGVALLNKQISDQNANWALQSGDISAEEKGLAAGQEIATTKVAQAASGLDITGGTAEAVRQSQTAAASFDQNIIRWDAAKTAYGYEAKGATDVAEANLDQMAAAQAKEAGQISMFSSFLGGASSVSSKWLQAKSAGIFS